MRIVSGLLFPPRLPDASTPPSPPKPLSLLMYMRRALKAHLLTHHPAALCGCASKSAVGGAGDGGDVKFYDSVSSKIQRYVLAAPVKGQNGDCPGDLNPELDETPP